ncbi:MAG: PTS N-acetyl-D-glucosamine transporter, partial [Gammaproteobacteria bacterium]|nr:PTS N-acetyl-D-glucosamine transporter [Gammaproteobacteria bacterium]
LRLLIESQERVDTDALRRLGARGLVRPSAQALQVVVGTSADQLAGELRAALQSDAVLAATEGGSVPQTAPAAASALAPRTVTAQTLQHPWQGDATALLAALGGRDNVRSIALAASRVRGDICDAARLDRSALALLGLRGVAVPRPHCVHLIVGPAAPAAVAALRELLPMIPAAQ